MGTVLHKPLGVALLVVLVLAGGALLLFDVRELVGTLARPRDFPVPPSPTPACTPIILNVTQPQPRQEPKPEARVVKSAPIARKRTRPAPPAGPVIGFPTQVPKDQVPIKHKFAIYRYTHAYGDLPLPLGLKRPTHDTHLEWAKRDRWYKWQGWDNSIAICACMFEENMQDVREWLLYHRWLGVDHVYLYENGPREATEAPPHVHEQLRDFIADGFVTLEAISRPYYQAFFYHACAVQHRHKYSWMAFIDLDEFIILRKKNTTLKKFLDGFKTEAGLGVNWVLVGPSGREDRPKEGGVLRAYNACVKGGERIVKSIANTYFLANIGGNPHTFEYRDDRPTVNEKHKPLGWRQELPKACSDGTVEDPKRDFNCRPVPSIAAKAPSIQDIAIFHYMTKSKAEFEAKMERGGGGGTHRKWKHFNSIRKHSSKGAVCALPAKLAKQCCDPARYELPALYKGNSEGNGSVDSTVADDDDNVDVAGIDVDDSDEEDVEAG